MMYDEKYYTNNNYASYLERSERYERMVQEIEYELFRILKLDFKTFPVLDYGCGVGFVVNSFQKLGYTNIWGYDVSNWAIEWGRKNVVKKPTIITNDFGLVESKHSKLMTAFDVFEHMSPQEIKIVLAANRPEHILVRIPLTICDNGKFILTVSEGDPTHITRLTRYSWINLFKENGYTFLFNVNVGSFYDSDGVMCAMFKCL